MLTPNDEAAILIYLRGTIRPVEAAAAACWEYARGNDALLEVAKFYKSARRKALLDFPNWVHDWQWAIIWRSPAFPAKRWIALSSKQKDAVCFHYPVSRPGTPLTTSVITLGATGVFEQWQAKADDHDTALLGRRVEARARERAIEHIVLTLDYRDGSSGIGEKLNEWLARPEQQKLLRKYKCSKQGADKAARPYIKALQYLAARELVQSFENPRLSKSKQYMKAAGWTEGKGPFYGSQKSSPILWGGGETAWRRRINKAVKIARGFSPIAIRAMPGKQTAVQWIASSLPVGSIFVAQECESKRMGRIKKFATTQPTELDVFGKAFAHEIHHLVPTLKLGQ